MLGKNTAQKRKKGWRSRKFVAGCLLTVLVLLLVGGGYIAWGVSSTRLPASMNMGTAGNMTMDHAHMPSGRATPIASLQAPQTAAHIRHFRLTARAVKLNIGGKMIEAWTYNGTAPGPTLRVRQGDSVEVKLTNTLPEGVTIHWHGVAVPNIADGVAGVTQNAVKQGETYTYRFIANDPGTYWYHSHQQSNEQVKRGLFGMLIVDPKQPSQHDDVDAGLVFHDWGQARNDHPTVIKARPGDWVRLRLLNTDNDQHQATLIGAPFTISALDGHNLNGPQSLHEVLLPIGSGQRYDLRFRMPAQGAVRLVETGKTGEISSGLSALIGDGAAPNALSTPHPAQFDFTDYGQPRSNAITSNAHFDNENTMTLGSYPGFFNGSFGSVYTINGKAFPDIPPIVVKEGQLVKIRIVNETSTTHPIHLHGHTFAVLTHNGKPLTGSPVYLDTINLHDGDSYEIGFRANNPGLWMDHCHNLSHAAQGMDMMVVYPNISTPFNVGQELGNIPE
ncbi:copper oxidase [Reticulibacter mediterranei]|uniref:Copper oxidase n=1 Tax=Reticulibacter mediterranei TaxID=2778369 RepID=A0A8J3N407_9CHLR|nr:multicopper oxidase family protein [Reticulibacter mediterranei]GHO97599.1 copper oxidase [Reticulibacter mediterranei]